MIVLAFFLFLVLLLPRHDYPSLEDPRLLGDYEDIAYVDGEVR